MGAGTQSASWVLILAIMGTLWAGACRPAVAGDLGDVLAGLAAGYLTYEILESLSDRGRTCYYDPWWDGLCVVPVPVYREYHYYVPPPVYYLPPPRVPCYRESRPLPRDTYWRYWSPLPGSFFNREPELQRWRGGRVPEDFRGRDRDRGYIEGRNTGPKHPGHLW